MSGIEIVSLIAACIDLTKTAIDAYNAVKHFKDLPEAFKEVSNKLPLVEQILQDAKTQLASATPNNELSAKMEPLLKNCEKKVTELRDIFRQLSKAQKKTVSGLYRTIVLKLGKESRVEELMKHILEDIQVLVASNALKSEMQNQIAKIREAIEELTRVKPSIPDQVFESGAGGFRHDGRGDLNVQYGDGDMNNVKGDMYKAQTMTFVKQYILNECKKNVHDGKVDQQLIPWTQLQYKIQNILYLLQNRLEARLDLYDVMIIDARNEPMPIPLQTITSKEIFFTILKDRFKDLGGNKIDRQEWFLMDASTNTPVDLSRPWHVAMKPNSLLYMSMVFRRRKIASTQCPSCNSENPGLPDADVQCTKCSLTYRRIEDIQDIEISTETRSSSITEQKQSNAKAQAPRIAEKFPKPRPPPKPRIRGDEIASYKRVQIIDTTFQIYKASANRNVNSQHTLLSIELLEDLEAAAAFLSSVYGLPEEQCLAALQTVQPELLSLRNEYRRSLKRKSGKRMVAETKDESFDVESLPSTPTSVSSGVNNPKLLTAVEDAIRRLILPELNELREERLKQERKAAHSTPSASSPPASLKIKMHSDAARRNVTLRRLSPEEAAQERAVRRNAALRRQSPEAVPEERDAQQNVTLRRLPLEASEARRRRRRLERSTGIPNSIVDIVGIVESQDTVSGGVRNDGAWLEGSISSMSREDESERPPVEVEVLDTKSAASAVWNNAFGLVESDVSSMPPDSLLDGERDEQDEPPSIPTSDPREMQYEQPLSPVLATEVEDSDSDRPWDAFYEWKRARDAADSLSSASEPRPKRNEVLTF